MQGELGQLWDELEKAHRLTKAELFTRGEGSVIGTTKKSPSRTSEQYNIMELTTPPRHYGGDDWKPIYLNGVKSNVLRPHGAKEGKVIGSVEIYVEKYPQGYRITGQVSDLLSGGGNMVPAEFDTQTPYNERTEVIELPEDLAKRVLEIVNHRQQLLGEPPLASLPSRMPPESDEIKALKAFKERLEKEQIENQLKEERRRETYEKPA